MKNKRSPVLVYFITALLLLMMYFGIKYYLAGSLADVGAGPRVVIYIKAGTSVKEIARILEEKKVVPNRWIFLAYGFLRGSLNYLKPGEYEFRIGMSMEAILAKLVAGKVITHQVIIPEGSTMREIARVLAIEGLVEEERFLELAKNPEILAAYGIQGHSLEGYLFPDTYNLTKGMKEEEIIHRMVNRFRQIFGPEEEARARELRMSPHQVVTLASIIEKEAVIPREMPLISGVFHNRLRQSMPLQADPTVYYAIKRQNGRLSRKDLRTESSYNTYLRLGLPPGPIASPGKAALVAALYPEKTKYLYFVSKNDGTHYFSSTLAEHKKAVRRYQVLKEKE